MEMINATKVFRVSFKNVHEANQHGTMDKWNEGMERTNNLQISAIGLSEINADLENERNSAQIRRCIKTSWKRSKVVMRSCRGVMETSHLPGETVLGVSKGYETRVQENGMEPQGMGCYSFTVCLHQ